MKIIGLTASNVKKLIAIELKPGDKNLLEVTGKNGQGKSSVLDSIWYALGGGDTLPQEPVKHGAEEAAIEIDLGDLVVTRKINLTSTTLVVKNKEGARYPKPQAILDRLVGQLTFDPLEFLRLKPLDQKNQLLRLVGLGEQLETLAQEDEKDQNTRLLLGRDLKRYSSTLDNAIKTTGEPVKDLQPVDVQQIIEEIDIIDHENQKAIQADQAAENERREKKRERQNLAAVYQHNIEELARLERENDEYDKKIAKLDQELEKEVVLAPKRSTAELRKKMMDSTRINQQVAYAKEFTKLQQDLQEVRDKLSDVNFKINERTAVREQMVREAAWPLPGLSADADGVRFNDIPLDQASTAEQLKVSCALAMVMNPQLRVILIRDGSLLDRDNLQVIQELAREKDYQVWVERVESGTGEPLVVMEDGLAK